MKTILSHTITTPQGESVTPQDDWGVGEWRVASEWGCLVRSRRYYALDSEGSLDEEGEPLAVERMVLAYERGGNLLIILGAPDPEMARIEALAREAGCQVAYATIGGRRVKPAEAYSADGYEPVGKIPQTVVWVECGGLLPGAPCVCGRPATEPAQDSDECGACGGHGPGPRLVIVDHHRPGDPGFGAAPADFLPGSSLGQVLALLAEAANAEDLLCAASDHCPGHAYQGRCPGVEPEALMAWRAATRAAFLKRPVGDILADVERATSLLQAAPELDLGGSITVRDTRTLGVIPELPEAALRLGLAYLAELPGQGLRLGAASPEQVRAFKSWASAEGYPGVYGDPERGYAGTGSSGAGL